MSQDMQLHPIEELDSGKEIHCEDCGFVYWIPREEISSTCIQCGNIAYHPGFTDDANERLQKQSARLAGPVADPEPATRIHHALSKDGKLDPGRIEEIAIEYQQEWQLWSFVVRNFADPHAHLAYLSFLSRNLSFATGTRRYSEYRAYYLPLTGEKWRVAKADAMLEQIQGLCDVQFQRSMKRESVTRASRPLSFPTIYRRITIGLLCFSASALIVGALWLFGSAFH